MQYTPAVIFQEKTHRGSFLGKLREGTRVVIAKQRYCCKKHVNECPYKQPPPPTQYINPICKMKWTSTTIMNTTILQKAGSSRTVPVQRTLFFFSSSILLYSPHVEAGACVRCSQFCFLVREVKQ